MTNNEAGTPLWSDQDIHDEIGIVSDAMLDYASSFEINLDHVLNVCKALRDDHQAKIAELEAARAADAQTIAQLRAQVAAANELIETLQGLYYGEGSTQPGGEGDNE